MAEMVRTAKTAGRENGFGAVLSDESFEKFRSIMYMRRAEKGSSLFREGDDADKLYYLFEGRVKSTKTSDAGESLTLYLHQAGDLMGQPAYRLRPGQRDDRYAHPSEMNGKIVKR